MNDTVREDLQTKISARLMPPMRSSVATAPKQKPVSKPLAAPPPIVAKKRVTAGLVSHKTSPTLVEFQNKNAALPDWRIQLQNAVNQRKGSQTETNVCAGSDTQDAINAEPALKPAPMPQADVAVAAPDADPRVASALRRIAESRETFHEVPPQPRKQLSSARRFGIVSGGGQAAATAVAPARISLAPKPVLVDLSPRLKRNTNKLRPVETLERSEPATAKTVIETFGKTDTAENIPTPKPAPEFDRIHIHSEVAESLPIETASLEADEIEDLAPMSMRFGAGLFDFIIGSFAAMLLLSPFAFTTASWFTMASVLTFAAAFAVFMFAYMTACLGLWGKTMGMRLFQLELVDAADNEYPTLRQASISSSVFLISTACGGAGFLTVFFNEENRALHDLLSGTILVREF